jgi:hypothetical protein
MACVPVYAEPGYNKDANETIENIKIFGFNLRRGTFPCAATTREASPQSGQPGGE